MEERRGEEFSPMERMALVRQTPKEAIDGRFIGSEQQG